MRTNNTMKFLWRLIMKCYYNTLNIRIMGGVFFNQSTVFGGWNKIHSKTVVSGAKIGKYSFIGRECYMPNAEIGKFCSIGNNVKIVDVTHPTTAFISTHPAFFSINKQCGKTFVSENLFSERLSIEGRSCIIGNDVWIGDDVRIIGGHKIGDGAIIALGAIVTKDIPPYAIVAGVPAKVIRYRFNESKIDELIKLKWWDKDESWIKFNLIEERTTTL